ncbi:hypothetical protein LI90_372 [Carbonactinospora thermoautotrophica]|uniref:Uncharacterized protein n=1 Tax=Carbonactinospora thermoautotrophica TaxID=1469144 RepID=A0A132MLS5_9ACTN|nr:hypothetical protein LI90_372 [Carbonactinospora thermoautotrophica]
MRGEDDRVHLGYLHARGSPPRAWGGLGLGEFFASRCRITPTCVGRT